MKIIFLQGLEAEIYQKRALETTESTYHVSECHSNMGYYKNERGKWICFDNRDGEMHTSVEFTAEDCLIWLTQRVDNEGVR